jgi:homoserine dehydrogenase
MSLEQFRARVEEYLDKHDMTPTAFGKRFAGDPLFVFQLRTGREPREATRDRVLSAMAAPAPERAA